MSSPKKKIYLGHKGQPLSQELQRQQERRSKHIIFLRKFFCITLAFMLTILITWPQIEKFFNNRLDEENNLKNLSLQNKIHQPSMHSYDKDQRPFNINAQSAEQIASEEVDLEQPFSKHILQNGVEVEIKGNKGHFHQETKLLNYQENVKLKTSSGYEFKTSSALVDTNNKKVIGSEEVIGKGPSSEIKAEGFTIENSGEKIHFTGKSKLTLHPSTSKNTEGKGTPYVK